LDRASQEERFRRELHAQKIEAAKLEDTYATLREAAEEEKTEKKIRCQIAEVDLLRARTALERDIFDKYAAKMQMEKLQVIVAFLFTLQFHSFNLCDR
jgi:hypothetical protein